MSPIFPSNAQIKSKHTPFNTLQFSTFTLQELDWRGILHFHHSDT